MCAGQRSWKLYNLAWSENMMQVKAYCFLWGGHMHMGFANHRSKKRWQPLLKEVVARGGLHPESSFNFNLWKETFCCPPFRTLLYDNRGTFYGSVATQIPAQKQKFCGALNIHHSLHTICSSNNFSRHWTNSSTKSSLPRMKMQKIK